MPFSMLRKVSCCPRLRLPLGTCRNAYMGVSTSHASALPKCAFYLELCRIEICRTSESSLKCGAGFLPSNLLTLDYGLAEIGQAAASDKDIRLAWERIETFLWKHVGPASYAHSTDHTRLQSQLSLQDPGAAMKPLSEATHNSGAAHVSSSDGIEGLSNIRTPSNDKSNADA